MSHFASVCTSCWMLLYVIGSCCAKFETGQTCEPTTSTISFVPWSPKHSTTILYPFAQLLQHCVGHTCALPMVFKVLWVVSFPWCTAALNIVTQDYQHGQISVGSCCVRLHRAQQCKCNCFYNDQVTLIVCSPCPLHLVVLMLTRSWSSLERVHMQPCSKEFAGNATASSSCQYSPQLVHEILGTI